MSGRSISRLSLRLAETLLCSSVVASLLCSAPVWGAPEAEKPIETVANTPYSATFIVNANAAYIRSGPADSYYPTMKLDKGARVKAVGMKLDWLKIVPPDGSFCYISKAHVNRNGDGSVGKVSGDAVNVRAGSSMNAMKVVTLCQLGVGEEVKIVGEQDEYFKIAPPAGKAFLYINKQLVDPDPTATPEKQEPSQLAKNDEVKPNTPQEQPKENEKQIAEGPAATQPSNEKIAEGPATTQPTKIAKGPASTQPSDEVTAIETAFEKAEADYAAAKGKPLDQQPIKQLIAEYEPLVASDKLTNTLHRIAETKLANLRMQEKAADELAKAKAEQEAMEKKQLALKAERQELEDRLHQLGIASYTAVGELQMSSLQTGDKTLYRLTDPANERTICYVRTDDKNFVSHIGEFVGLRGELKTEDRLGRKVLNASEIAKVDPTKVNHTVTASLVPPSLSPTSEATPAAEQIGK